MDFSDFCIPRSHTVVAKETLATMFTVMSPVQIFFDHLLKQLANGILKTASIIAERYVIIPTTPILD